MLSISEAIKGVSDAVKYYLDKGREAYYLAGVGHVGRWFGQAVESLNLPERVTARAFRNLLSGYSPDGRRPLVQNAGDSDRDAAWDLTFSVPKPVSVLWAMSSAEGRRAIEAAQRTAVETALRAVETYWGFTRRGPGGRIHERAKMLFATFEDYVSRAHDMQMHTHCVLINTVVRRDGTTGALHSIDFFRAKKVLGAVHEVELAKQLRARLGVNIEPARVGFGITGIPETVCEHFSKRRAAIVKRMEENQLSGPVAAKAVTRETRPRKLEIPPDRLFPHWQAEAQALGWGPEQAAQLLQQRHTQTPQPVKPALQASMLAIPPEQQTRSRVLDLARIKALEHGVGGQDLLASLDGLRLPQGQAVLWRPFPSQSIRTESPAGENRIPAQTHSAEGKRPPSLSREEQEVARPSTPAGVSSAQPEPTIAPAEAKRAASEGQATPPKEPHRSESSAHANDGCNQSSQPSASPRLLGAPESQSQSTREHPGHEEQRSGTNQTQREETAGGAEQESTEAKRQAQSNQGRGKPRPGISPDQHRRNRDFERAFGAAVDRIFPEKQTRARLTRLAEKFAQKHGADRDTLDRTLRTMRPGAERSFLHVERPRLFPHSPIAALKWLRVSKLALGDKPSKWGDIRWKKDLVIGELRVQQRRLFPQADRWSPLHKLTLPALHFSFQKSQWRPRDSMDERATKTHGPLPATESQKQTGKDQQQDHSHWQ